MNSNLVESNINWLGKIPKNWTITKVKNVFYYHKNIAKEQSSDFNRISLTMNGVIIRDKDDANGLQPEDFYNYQIVRKDDIIFKLIDLENVNTSRVGRSNFEGITSPAYILLHEKNKKTDYYDYYFKNMYYQEIFNNLGGNGVRSAINKEELLNMPIIIPTSDDAIRISNYLNANCKKIDDIIDDNNKQIELLNEYKSCVFLQKLKDYSKKFNGTYWKYAQMRRITEFITCGIAATPEYAEDSNGLLFLSAQNIKNQKLDLSKKNYITDNFRKKLSTKTIPKKGDILQVRVGGTIGNTAIVDIDDEFGVYVSLTHIRTNNLVYNKYLQQYMETPKFLFEALSTVDFVGSQGNLNVGILKGIKVLLPPLELQTKIALDVEKEINKINKIIEYRNKINDLLFEYKKSLIYEVVTGKKEV